MINYNIDDDNLGLSAAHHEIAQPTESNDSGEENFKKKDSKSRSSKLQDFQIRIKVFEARQLEGNNINPMCQIKCSNLSKYTKKKLSTNSPFFDEVFFFNFHTSQSELFDES